MVDANLIRVAFFGMVGMALWANVIVMLNNDDNFDTTFYAGYSFVLEVCTCATM